MAEQPKKVPSRQKEENANDFEKIMEGLSETRNVVEKKLKDCQLNWNGTNKPGEKESDHDKNMELLGEEELSDMQTLCQKLTLTMKVFQKLHDDGKKVTEETQNLKEQLKKAKSDQIELEKSFTKKDQEWQIKLREAEASIKELEKSPTERDLEMQRKLRNAEEGKKYSDQKIKELDEECDSLTKKNQDYQTKLRDVEDKYTRKLEELKVKDGLLTDAVSFIKSLEAIVAELRSELQQKGETCEKLTKKLDKMNNSVNKMREEFQEFKDSTEVKNEEMKQELEELKDELKEQKSGGSQSHPL